MVLVSLSSCWFVVFEWNSNSNRRIVGDRCLMGLVCTLFGGIEFLSR